MPWSRLRSESVEILLEDGWWEVELAGRDDGGNFVVGAKRYHVQHTVPCERLRPAWKWVRQDRRWEVHEKAPQALTKAELNAAKASPKAKAARK